MPSSPTPQRHVGRLISYPALALLAAGVVARAWATNFAVSHLVNSAVVLGILAFAVGVGAMLVRRGYEPSDPELPTRGTALLIFIEVAWKPIAGVALLNAIITTAFLLKIKPRGAVGVGFALAVTVVFLAGAVT